MGYRPQFWDQQYKNDDADDEVERLEKKIKDLQKVNAELQLSLNIALTASNVANEQLKEVRKAAYTVQAEELASEIIKIVDP